MLIMRRQGIGSMQVRDKYSINWIPKPTLHPEYFRTYLTQVRQELAARLVERLYADGSNKPSKWWMAFQKRRFMNRSLTT